MSKDLRAGFAATLMVRDACLCLHVQRAARRLARRFDEAFRHLGITHGQFSLLNALNRPVPARMADVADLLAMDRTTLTAALKTLERNGLAAVAVDPSDRRSRLLSLTDAGREKLSQAMPIWIDEHAKVEAALADPDRLRADLDIVS